MDSTTGYPSFAADGLEDKDFNGVVDDGICRWRAADIVKSCAYSGPSTSDTIDIAGPVLRQCLEDVPVAGDFLSASCAFDPAESSGGNGAVLRWSTLPYYPLQASAPPQSLAEAMFPLREPVATRQACSSMQVLSPGECTGQQPTQLNYTSGLSPVWQAPWHTPDCLPDDETKSLYTSQPPTSNEVERCSLYADLFARSVRSLSPPAGAAHAHAHAHLCGVVCRLRASKQAHDAVANWTRHARVCMRVCASRCL